MCLISRQTLFLLRSSIKAHISCCSNRWFLKRSFVVFEEEFSAWMFLSQPNVFLYITPSLKSKRNKIASWAQWISVWFDLLWFICGVIRQKNLCFNEHPNKIILIKFLFSYLKAHSRFLLWVNWEFLLPIELFNRLFIDPTLIS